jgi:two-component system, response regulator FlrC
MSDVRILVVEDDPDIQHCLSDCLAAWGFDTQVAATARQALAAVEVANYRGVILGVHMPGMNGIELLGRLRESHPGLPVIMLTGDPALRERCLALGARAFLTKPFEKRDLREAIDRCMTAPEGQAEGR